MKVAILGARGIPARYGGFDTFVEELVRGFEFVDDIQLLVYCRSNYYKSRPKSLHGARLVYITVPRLKGLESLLQSFLCSLHVLSKNVDLIYFVDPGNAPFALFLRLCGKRVIVHTDGLGWKRKKWGPIFRGYYKFAERICTRAANILITDNLEMEKYYRREYGAHTVYISYGASVDAGVNYLVYKEYGLLEKGYLLVVARLEPENNTELIIKEFTQSSISLPLVIVGDSPYNSKYMRRLQQFGDERVRFFGRINDQAKLNALYRGTYLYIHGHEVGGTNPSLLRAMDAGSAPLVFDVPFNKSVIDKSGFVFNRDTGHLCSMLEYLVDNDIEVARKGRMAQKRAETLFKWKFAVEEHKKLFYHLAGKGI